MFIREEFFNKMTRGVVKNRDVLLYKDGGKPGTFKPHVSFFGDGFPFEVFAINEHVYRLRVIDELSQIYLYFWLSSEKLIHEMKIKSNPTAPKKCSGRSKYLLVNNIENRSKKP